MSNKKNRTSGVAVKATNVPVLFPCDLSVFPVLAEQISTMLGCSLTLWLHNLSLRGRKAVL
jgi:hypothetical protein